MQIDFTDHNSRLSHKERELLEKILLHAAKTEQLPDRVELSLMIVSNDEIKTLKVIFPLKKYKKLIKPPKKLDF